MPRYQITDSDSGRTMVVEGDAPPTDQEAADLFGSLAAPSTPTNRTSETQDYSLQQPLPTDRTGQSVFRDPPREPTAEELAAAAAEVERKRKEREPLADKWATPELPEDQQRRLDYLVKMGEANPREPSMIKKALLTKGGRLGDAAIGVAPAIAGALLGTAIEPGGGTAVGGGAGAIAGESLVQMRQYLRGERDDVSKGRIIVAGGAGAIVPDGALLTSAPKVIATRAAQGAGIAGATDATGQLIDTGTVDFEELTKSAAFGSIFGGVAGGVEAALVRRNVLKAIRQTPEFSDFKGTNGELVDAVRAKLNREDAAARAAAAPEYAPPAEIAPGAESSATPPAAEPTPPVAPPSSPAMTEFEARAGMAAPPTEPVNVQQASDGGGAAIPLPSQMTTPAAPEGAPLASAPEDASGSMAGQSEPVVDSGPATESAGGQAAPEVSAPVEIVKPKGTTLSPGMSPDGGMDLLTHIHELGGVGTPNSVRNPGGEYDGFNEAFGVGPARLLRRKGAQGVDTLMQELQSSFGYSFPSSDDFYTAVKRATAARQQMTRAIAKQTYEAKVTAALFENAGRSAKTKPKAAVVSDSLRVGDAFRVHGELYTVSDLSPDTGAVTLSGAAKLQVAPGTKLYPDHGRIIKAPAPEIGGAQPFEPDTPYLPGFPGGGDLYPAVPNAAGGAGQVSGDGGNSPAGKNIGVDPATYLADPIKFAGPLAAALGKAGTISSIVADYFAGQLPSWSPIDKVINSPADVGAMMAPLRNPHAESYKVIVLGAGNRVRHAEVLHIGNLGSVDASLAAILRVVNKTKAKRIILSHNHPGGDPSPSSADWRSHDHLLGRLSDHGVSLMDHVITDGHAAYSMARNALVPMEHDAPAPWERVRRTDLKAMNDVGLVSKLAAELRQANPESKFILYLNNRAKLTAIEQVPARMAEDELLRQIETGAAREGAGQVIITARTKHDAPPRWLHSQLARSQIRLLDVITELEGSHYLEFPTADEPPRRISEIAVREDSPNYGSLDPEAPLIASAKGKPTDYAKVTLAHLKDIKIVQMPELVRLVRELTGTVPQIRKLRGGTLGQFSSGDATIRLDTRIFVDPVNAAKTLAHEIGHLVDYLPHATLKRGNLLGRLHSLRAFLKNEFGGAIVKNKELREELLALTQWWKPYPATAKDWFVAYRESAPELYADAISVLFNSPAMLKEKAPKFWAEFFKGLDKKPEVKAELLATWDFLNNPHMQVLERRSEDIRKMFLAGDEILLRKQAEREARFATFRGWNDRFRQELFDVFDPLVNRATKIERAGGKISPKFNPRLLFDEHPLAADNSNYRMLQQLWEKVIKPVEAEQFTLHELGEYLFLQRVLNERFADTIKTTGRAQLANPLGMTPETARLGLLRMRLQAGDVRFTRLTAAADKFHAIVFESIKQAVDVGAYSKKIFQEVLAPNRKSYVTFAVLDHLQDYVPAGLRMQAGTFKEIANPFTATVLKMISLHRLIALQRAKIGAVDFLKQFDPASIAAAPVTYDGARWHVSPSKDPDKATLELLADGKPAGFHVDPAIVEMFDKLPNATVSAITTVLNWPFRQLIYPLIIKYNPAFQLVLSPAKDLRRTIVNMPGAKGLKYAGEFVRNYLTFLGMPATEAGTAVRAYLRGEPHPLIAEMIAKQAIGTPLDNFAVDLGRGDKMEALLRDFGLLPAEQQRGVLQMIMTPVTALAQRLEFAGLTFEMLPKVTAYKILTRELGWTPKEAAYFARNNVGVPNISKKGKHVQVLDAVLPFLKISLNGLRADLALARHPKTAGGWWFRWALSDGIWTMLQAAAALGILGGGLKELYDGVSDYNKTNYNVLPVGSIAGGQYGKRVVYLRFPRDPTHRLMSGLLYQALISSGAAAMQDPKQKGFVGPAMSLGADQVPGLNPVLKIGNAWAEFLEGQNPMDGFRGKPVLTNAEWLTGGWDAYKKMFGYTLQNTGVMNFVNWDPTAASASEMSLSAVPGLNRFVQTTDAGYRERQEEQLQGEARDHAQLRLDMPTNVQSLLSEYFWLNSVGKTRTLEQTQRLMELGSWHNRIYKPYADLASAEQTFGRGLSPDTKKALETASQVFERAKR